MGYTFDPRLLNRIKLQSLRIYGNVQNPKTWSRNTGYTPEVGTKLFFEAAAGGLEPIFDGDVSNRYEVADFCCETVKEYFDNRTL
mgnify:CR=1 FL=1